MVFFLHIVLFGVGFLIFISVAVFSFFVEKKRREEMAAQVGQLGLQFAAKGLQPIPYLDQFALFGRGRSQTLYNIMRGSVEGIRGLVAFKARA